MTVKAFSVPFLQEGLWTAGGYSLHPPRIPRFDRILELYRQNPRDYASQDASQVRVGYHLKAQHQISSYFLVMMMFVF